VPPEVVVAAQADQMEGNPPNGGANELIGKPVGNLHKPFGFSGMRFGAVPGWLIDSLSFPDYLLATGVPIRQLKFGGYHHDMRARVRMGGGSAQRLNDAASDVTLDPVG
jgi:hypothetical protein